MRYIFVTLLLTACSMPEPKKMVYTELQMRFLGELNTEKATYMESCLISYKDFGYCQEKLGSLGKANCPSQSSGGSITNTAIGTAIGYGAAKVFFGH